MATARAPRVGRAPRTARAGRRMAHSTRRKLAPSPDAVVDRVAAAVGRAFAEWASRFVELVVRDLVQVDRRFHADATVRGLFEEAGRAAPDPKVLEQAFRMLDNQSADEVRVAGVRTADVVTRATDRQAEWVRQNTDLIKAESDMRRRVERVIADPLNEGRSVADVTKLLQEQAGYARSRAELTARDQTLKMYGQLQEARQRAAGITKYVWTTSLDERVREDHARLDGTVQSWDDPPVVDQRTGRRGHPGSDFQCFPGRTQIAFTSPVNGAFRRWYTGQLATFVTDTGETLECTPNHPVLTAAGWKPAQAVQVGDNVVQACTYRREFFEAHVQNSESSIAQVFDALALTFGLGRPVAIATQFHGDASADEQIDVVNVDGELRPDIKAALLERVGELDFTDANAPRFRLRQAAQVLDRLGLASDCSVRALRLRLAQFFGRFSETLDVGLATIADVHAFTDQEGADALARHAEPLGQAFDRGTIPLQLQAFVLREWLRVRCRQVDAPPAVDGADFLPDRLLVEPQLTCDAGPGQTLTTKRARVVQCFLREFTGHVYNLSTGNSWYVAQRLFVHNCRCTAVPVLDDEAADPAEAQTARAAQEQAIGEGRFARPAPPAPPRERAMQPTPAELQAEADRRAAAAASARAELEANAAADRRIAAARRAAELERLRAEEAARAAAAAPRTLPEITAALPTQSVRAERGIPAAAARANVKRATDLYEQLTAPQQQALRSFTGGYYRVARALQTGLSVEAAAATAQVLPERAAKIAAMLPDLAAAQSGMRVANPTEAGPLYRGLGLDDTTLQQWLTKDSVEFAATSNSTTYNPKVAINFAEAAAADVQGLRKVILKVVDVDEAAAVMYKRNVVKREQEMIVGRKRFKVTKRAYDPKTDTHLIELQQERDRRDAADERLDGPTLVDYNRYVSNGAEFRLT